MTFAEECFILVLYSACWIRFAKMVPSRAHVMWKLSVRRHFRVEEKFQIKQKDLSFKNNRFEMGHIVYLVPVVLVGRQYAIKWSELVIWKQTTSFIAVHVFYVNAATDFLDGPASVVIKHGIIFLALCVLQATVTICPCWYYRLK